MNYIDVPIGAVIPFLFDTFAAAGGSVTLTGLATTDIKILKGTALTAKPTPTSGVALLDTDGIDVTGGGTGIHGFSIDTGNTTDSGYFAVGSYYNVIVDSVTIDSQTVRFIAGAFRLIPAEAQVGYRKVDAQYVAGVAPEDAGDLAGAVWEEDLSTHSGSVGSVAEALASVPDANSNADALLTRSDGIETGYTLRSTLRIVLSATAGKSSGHGTGTVIYRDVGDTANRISATVSAGNRTAVTLVP